MKEIVEILIKLNETISTMESCTGGFVANSITNIPGASEIFNFGAVTYSNDYKVKMGVNKDLIDEFSVYSPEVAEDMARKISDFTNSNYGVGVTGKLKKSDPDNLSGSDDVAYLSIYDRDNNKFYDTEIKLPYDDRVDNKNEIIDIFIDNFLNIK